MGGREGDGLVSVATAPNEVAAGLWREALEAAGIPVLLRAVGPGIGAWGSTFSLEHDLSVRAADAERARDLLAELEAEE